MKHAAAIVAFGFGVLGLDSTGIALTLSGGDLIVSVPAGHAVEVLDSTTGADLDSFDLGNSTLPHGVVVESTSSVLVAEPASHRVLRVDVASGVASLVASFGGADPTGIALNGSGDALVTVPSQHAVKLVDVGTGTVSHLASLPSTSLPHGIVLGPQGRVFVADPAGHKVYEIDAGTGGVSTFASFSGNVDPTGLAIDPTGGLYVTAPQDHKVYHLDLLGSASVIANLGGATLPHGIVVHDGRLLVADPATHNVFDVDPISGSFSQFAGFGGLDPTGLAVVSEPSTALGIGFAALAFLRRRLH